jgi:hypothetical protein
MNRIISRSIMTHAMRKRRREWERQASESWLKKRRMNCFLVISYINSRVSAVCNERSTEKVALTVADSGSQSTPIRIKVISQIYI